MSTKSSILYSNGQYYLYTDAFDDEPRPVYLRLSGVQFEASNNELTVRIPRTWAEALNLVKVSA